MDLASKTRKVGFTARRILGRVTQRGGRVAGLWRRPLRSSLRQPGLPETVEVPLHASVAFRVVGGLDPSGAARRPWGWTHAAGWGMGRPPGATWGADLRARRPGESRRALASVSLLDASCVYILGAGTGMGASRQLVE